MKIYQGIEEVGEINNAVVTTGSFDGVHVGHKSILNRLKTIADGIHGETVLITFHPHPRKILFPETAGRNLYLINSQQEKIDLLRKTGLDHLLIIRFTPEFAKLSSIDFVRKILVGQLNARKIVVGFNHHFGHNQEGDYEILYELGKYYNFEVEEIPEQDIENETVSSTRIRKALLEGKIQRANAYLDHFYFMKGKLSQNSLDGPFANSKSYRIEIEEDCKLIPPVGVYAISIEHPVALTKGMAIITTGNEPGFTNNMGRMAVIIPFDSTHNFQDQVVSVNFHKMMRESQETVPAILTAEQFIEDTKLIEELIY
jgi:riboflavin kinase / FMN adenylyltransferase